MKLIIIIGDAAVGKMTIGQELTKITNLRLFHNHMTIESVIDVFGYYDGKTITRLREVFFEEFSKSNNEGLIFTYMWAFDQPSDAAYIEHVSEIFRRVNAEIYYVELNATLEERLSRNVSENRLMNKASKRDIVASNNRLKTDSSRYRCVSFEGEIKYDNYLRIENTHLEAETVAQMIKTHFSL